MDHLSRTFLDHPLRVDAGDQIYLSHHLCCHARVAADDPRFLGSLASRPRLARVGFSQTETLHRLARHHHVCDRDRNYCHAVLPIPQFTGTRVDDLADKLVYQQSLRPLLFYPHPCHLRICS